MNSEKKKKIFYFIKPLAKDEGISSIEQKECSLKTDEEIM